MLYNNIRQIRTSSTSLLKRHNHAVAVQLDYYMSPQFAGVASALVNNTYASKGIDLTFLPICPVGLEQERVRIHQDENPQYLSIGTVEQNIFTPTLKGNPNLRTSAIAAMFSKSPLCIASLPSKDGESFTPDIIGAHEDSVEIMKKIFPQHQVVASPRSTKTRDLLSGKVGAIQAYTTTEVPTLRRVLHADPDVIEMERYNGAKLGYSQVIFAADECLDGDDRKDVARAFCEATFEGWANVIENPAEAVEMVKEAKLMLGLDDESNDHWHPSPEFELEMVQKCSEYVKGTMSGGKYGVIDEERWGEANEWLLSGKAFGLNASVWK